MGSAVVEKVRFWSNISDFCYNMGEVERKMHGRIVTVPYTLKFVDGQFETADEKEAEALRGCSVFGSRVFEHDAVDDEALVDAQEAFRAAQEKKKRGRPAGSRELADAFNPHKKK